MKPQEKPISYTKIEAIKNKIADLSNHGLNSNEINKYLTKITKTHLIRVIKDLIENQKTEETE